MCRHISHLSQMSPELRGLVQLLNIPARWKVLQPHGLPIPPASQLHCVPREEGWVLWEQEWGGLRLQGGSPGAESFSPAPLEKLGGEEWSKEQRSPKSSRQGPPGEIWLFPPGVVPPLPWRGSWLLLSPMQPSLRMSSVDPRKGSGGPLGAVGSTFLLIQRQSFLSY